ncbi:Zeaxanthin epoxidase [Cellulophaga geojensis KL-A]|uniref:Zeaxanthin epoxidase n=1 Tax=Cellulophaga geojensis KL-A TaxID=1328323 RepID=A0ABN0RQQ9_9FLAO|nr:MULTISPECIES: FAD-dependent monooxygenase [Cellulophaga]EWH14276.1 Zeaxanthin epoxidase [Cellulophaga geojensis KL-A]MDO6854903.1 FAD-dependent monooxygenase [Cellulophaga lytica]
MYAIIGAGIGGLTTALAFEKLNIPYHLYEKAEDINAIGAGIWLAPNALKVYEWLGILDQVKNAGNSIDRITIATADLQTLTDSKQDEAKEEYGYSTVAIHRAELQKVLANNVASSNISWGKGLKSYTETKEGVELQFLDATTTIVNYLIGADGINSVVRKQLFPKSKIRYSGQTCWRGVTNFKLPEDYNHRGIEMWGKQTRFGISKLSADKTSWFAVAKSKPFLTDNKETLKEDLLNEYKKYANVVTDLIANTNIDAILRNDIIDLKPIKKWHTNRVCLLGDAGHATTPNMGQGGAQAIEDAYFLSKIIATNTTDSPFKEFQKVRYKKVNSIVNQSWITGKVAHLGFGSKIRNMVFKNLPKSLIDKKMHFVYRLDNE